MGNYILCHSNTSGWAIGGELYHHGILGQKWGVRRFQNKDGSLTSAGKNRYSSNDERMPLDYQKHIDKKNGTLKDWAWAYKENEQGFKNKKMAELYCDAESLYGFAKIDDKIRYDTDAFGRARPRYKVQSESSASRFRKKFGEAEYEKAYERKKKVCGGLDADAINSILETEWIEYFNDTHPHDFEGNNSDMDVKWVNKPGDIEKYGYDKKYFPKSYLNKRRTKT